MAKTPKATPKKAPPSRVMTVAEIATGCKTLENEAQRILACLRTLVVQHAHVMRKIEELVAMVGFATIKEMDQRATVDVKKKGH